jgi:hypothetical protein
MWDAIGSTILILVILFAIGVEERLGLNWKWPRKKPARMGDAEIASKAREFADLKWILRAKGLAEDEAHKAAYEAVTKRRGFLFPHRTAL